MLKLKHYMNINLNKGIIAVSLEKHLSTCHVIWRKQTNHNFNIKYIADLWIALVTSWIIKNIYLLQPKVMGNTIHNGAF